MYLTCSEGQAAISTPWHVRPGEGYSRHCNSRSSDPWNEHTEKAFKKPPDISQTTKYCPFCPGIYVPKGVSEADGAEPKQLFRSASSIWSFNPHSNRFWGRVIRCGLSKQFFKNSSAGWRSFILLHPLGRVLMGLHIPGERRDNEQHTEVLVLDEVLFLLWASLK